MCIALFRSQLREARAKLEKALEPGRDIQDWLAAFEAVSIAQRKLAGEQKTQFAQPLEVGFSPEAAVPAPALFQTELGCAIIFRAKRKTAEGRFEDAGWGILELELCSLTKFGYPNDEALPGHPLYDWGLTAYGIFEVLNSDWIKLMTQQNRVAFPKTRESTDRHFIITFHDSTFECISRGFRACLDDRPYFAIVAGLQKKLLGGDQEDV